MCPWSNTKEFLVRQALNWLPKTYDSHPNTGAGEMLMRFALRSEGSSNLLLSEKHKTDQNCEDVLHAHRRSLTRHRSLTQRPGQTRSTFERHRGRIPFH